jgi:hypothetical protein
MLTLIVPGLIWTRQALADLTFDLPLPAFTTLLGRGRLRHLPPADTTAHLAAAGGLRRRCRRRHCAGWRCAVSPATTHGCASTRYGCASPNAR